VSTAVAKWRSFIKQDDVRDMTYGCALASQAGIGIAGPVLIALALGYWIDLRLGTLPWITLILTFVGAVVGPIVVYRWVTTAVRQRFAAREPAESAGDSQVPGD
jgi:F0F1-type ATP synthase assembly protein I